MPGSELSLSRESSILEYIPGDGVPVFAERRIFLRVVIDPNLDKFTIQVEGEGFDWHSWIDRRVTRPVPARLL